MRTRKEFTAKIIGTGGMMNISLLLDSKEIGQFKVELNDLNLSDEEKRAVLQADELEGTAYYHAMTQENNGVLKVLSLKPAGGVKPEETKNLKKEFNGKVLANLDDLEYTMVIETETLGTLHVKTKNFSLAFNQYRDMQEKGVIGTYEIEDDINDINTKKIKVTGLKAKK